MLHNLSFYIIFPLSYIVDGYAFAQEDHGSPAKVHLIMHKIRSSCAAEGSEGTYNLAGYMV